MITVQAKDRRRLADAVGLNEQYLYQCLTRRREFPVDRVMPLETAAVALGIPGVTRQRMRPNDWVIHWPELVGSVGEIAAQEAGHAAA